MKPVIHTENEPEVVSRITELLIKQGKTQTELLEALGLHRNNFTEWKAGRKRSYLLYIDEIARYFDVSPTYLLRGEEDEETMKLSQNEEKLIQMYRYLHPESKEKLMATAEVLVNLGRSNTIKIKKKRVGNDESSKPTLTEERNIGMSAKDNNESRLSMLERAEQLLAEGRIEEALDTLSAVEPDVGNRARLAYDYGVASVLLGFPDKADRFFTLPITEGYNIPGSLVWLGKAYEQQGDGNAAEEMYLSAVDEAGEDFLIPNKVLCDYYYRNAMYIKAERCAHRAAECDPADYYGIHMLVRIHQKRDMLREAEELLMSREEAFGDYPGYWYDRVENLELQGRYYPAIQLLETEPRIARIMPEEMMRLKLKLYLRRMQRDEARMMLQQLADNYHDTDATFFDMMFALAEGKLERAQALAERLIADNRDEEGLVVHTARLMRVFILANTIEAEEFDRQKTALKAESEACMAWFREQGYSIDLCGEALENLFNNRKADE